MSAVLITDAFAPTFPPRRHLVAVEALVPSAAASAAPLAASTAPRTRLRLTRRGRAALRRPGRLRVTVGAALADLAAMRATRL